MIGFKAKIKKNQFYVEKKLKKKLSNSIITFFFILQFLYGFNFGFIDLLNKKIRRFCKCITLLISLYTTAILFLASPIFLTERDIRVFWGSLVLLHYCGHMTLLNFSKYKVHNFITDIRSIYCGIIYSKENNFGWLACLAFGCMLAITVMSSAVFCTATNSGCMLKNNIVNAIYMISLIGLDAIVLVQLIVNFYTYYAVEYLVGLVGREKTCLIRKQFFRVSKCCEKFSGYYGNLVLLELLIHLPKYLLLVCNFIYNFHGDVMLKTYLIRLWYSNYVLFQMCAPAVSVEVVKKQMESLRLELYARLIEEKDVEKHLELSSLLRYMKEKPLYRKSWRVIPTDINLVVSLLSFITTYIIVIVQFMHIY